MTDDKAALGGVERVTLHCPYCKRTMQVARDETDPPATVRVETMCDNCDHGGNFPEVLYFDKDGNQLECD